DGPMDDSDDEPDTSEPNSESNEKNDNLPAAKTKAIAEINALLSQEPQITNSDLSAEYQNWSEQIEKLTSQKEIDNLKNKVIIDIQVKREAKKKKKKKNKIFKKANKQKKKKK